jgi:type IV pilus assembly protein PilW
MSQSLNGTTMKYRHISVKQIRGLSLVELMVAITIGLIILAAVSSLFVNTKQTYTSQDSLARLQENARFAMHFLIKDIRLAGYFGCLDGVDPGPPVTVNPDTTVQTSNTKYNLQDGLNFALSPFIRLQGIENANGARTWLPTGAGAAEPAGMKPGTDAISIHRVDASVTANIAPGMLNGASPLVVDDAGPFNEKEVVVVSDCTTADVIEITGKIGNTLQHGTTGGNINNVSASLSKAYDPPSRVSRLSSRQYFVMDNANGVPALFRQDAGGTQELVEGIEDLQILYGEDTDAPPDGVPNIYRNAAAVVNWTQVMSVRIGILARTITDKSGDIDNESHDVDGDGTPELTAPGDRFRRRVFQAVVKLRNI